MSSMLVAPENENFPNRKRWTREECYRLMEIGELEGRWELIDGEIISKMSQKPPHRIVLNLIANWLITVYGFLHLQMQAPIAIPDSQGSINEPEPDIAVTIEPTTTYSATNPFPVDLRLVVEISDTALRFDLIVKSLLYARSGVKEYWVADVSGRKITVFSNPSAEGYAETKVYEATDQISPMDRPDAIAEVGQFFPTNEV